MKPPIKKPIDYLAIIKRIQSLLNKSEQKYTNQVIEAYTKSYKTILPHIDKLTLYIEAHPDITQTGIKRSKEYHDLIDVTEKELNSFVDYARTTIGIAIEASVLLSLSSVSQWGMKPVPPSALEVVTRFLQPDTALYDRIGLWAGNAQQGVIDAIIEGVGLGRNPRVIAQEITKAYGASLTDAMRTTRTVQLKAYNESTRLNYIANGIERYIRIEELDELTCEACWVEHGRIYYSSEPFESHYHCRGTLAPYTEELAQLFGIGEDLFNQESEEFQRKTMGNEKYEVWKAGMFEFSDMAKTVEDPVYGNMKVVTPLWELLGAESPQYMGTGAED